MESYKLGKTKIQIPSGWHEVNFNKAMEILEGELNEVQTIALLTDKSEKEIRQSTDMATIYYFINTFLYLHQLPLKLNEFPRSIKLGYDRIVFPFVNYGDEFDLGQADVGQVEDMIMIMTKMNKEFIDDSERTELTELELAKITPYLVAIYIQKMLDTEYDGAKALELVDRVKEELSFKECLSMGYFFFIRLQSYKNGSPSVWKSYHSRVKRLKRALSGLMQRMVSMLP